MFQAKHSSPITVVLPPPPPPQSAPEYKIPGLYVIDSIVRQSRHQFGIEKDVFATRFARNMIKTFAHLFKCPADNRVSSVCVCVCVLVVIASFLPSSLPPSLSLSQPKVIRVLNLWQKNGVFSPQVIQPLMASAPEPGKHMMPYSVYAGSTSLLILTPLGVRVHTHILCKCMCRSGQIGISSCRNNFLFPLAAHHHHHSHHHPPPMMMENSAGVEEVEGGGEGEGGDEGGSSALDLSSATVIIQQQQHQIQALLDQQQQLQSQANILLGPALQVRVNLNLHSASSAG